MEGRGQFSGIDSLRPLFGSQGLNSGYLSCRQTPLLAEPSHQPSTCVFLFVTPVYPRLCSATGRDSLPDILAWHPCTGLLPVPKDVFMVLQLRVYPHGASRDVKMVL